MQREEFPLSEDFLWLQEFSVHSNALCDGRITSDCICKVLDGDYPNLYCIVNQLEYDLAVEVNLPITSESHSRLGGHKHISHIYYSGILSSAQKHSFLLYGLQVK